MDTQKEAFSCLLKKQSQSLVSFHILQAFHILAKAISGKMGHADQKH